MYKLAVLGYPISHSRSPEIHQAFAKQCAIDLSYEKIAVKPEHFIDTIKSLQQDNYLGVNITLPLKELAYQYTANLTLEAKLAGAVNTLHLQQNPILGANTDGLGFIQDLQLRHHYQLKDKTILLLGAGGAARGILGSIYEQKPKKLYLYNRTLQKAQNLVKNLTLSDCDIITHIDEIFDLPFDILINTTAENGFYTLFKDLPINLSQRFCYDLNYGKFHQSFIEIMQRKHGSNYTNGYGMLLEQAAISFELWFGVLPMTTRIY